jgi:cytochrome c553
MRLLTTLSAVAMAGTFAVPASADIAAGKAKANAACAVCHGVQGGPPCRMRPTWRTSRKSTWSSS